MCSLAARTIRLVEIPLVASVGNQVYGDFIMRFVRALYPTARNPQDVVRVTGITRSQTWKLIQGTGDLTPEANERIASKLSELLEDRLKDIKDERELDRLLEAMGRPEFVKTAWVQRIAWVDPTALYRLWEGNVGKRSLKTTRTLCPEKHGRKRIVVEEEPDPAVWDRQEHRVVRRLLRLAERVGAFMVEAVDARCTRYRLELSDEAAERLVTAFRRGELADLGVKRVYQSAYPENIIQGAEQTPPAPLTSEQSAEIEKSALAALRRERWQRPWVRLAGLLSPVVQFLPVRRAIAASAEQAFSSRGLSERLPALRSDLRAAVFVWPVLTAFLVALSGLVASACGVAVDIPNGVAIGVLMAVIGALPCATVISPLACGAGGVFLGWTFGFASEVVLGKLAYAPALTRSAVLSDPWATVTGGLMGLTAHDWPGALRGPLIGLLLVCTGFGIAVSGWLMGQPLRAANEAPKPWWRDALGALGGACGGTGIPAVMGLTAVGIGWRLAPMLAFGLAFALVGGLYLLGCVWWNTHSILRAVVWAAVHAVGTAVLCAAVYWFAGGPFGVLAVAVSCAWYESTWFTASFILGKALSSRRGAVWAAGLEGVCGYLGFVIGHMLQHPN